MTIQFQSKPLREKKPLTIRKFKSGVVNLKIVHDCGIIVGATSRGLERGRFHCNRFYEKFDLIEQENMFEYKSLLSCLVKLGYITDEEQQNELAWLRTIQFRQRLAENKRDVIHLFTNPEFIKYLEQAKERIPEWLTRATGPDKDFALALIKLKEVVDDV